MPERAAFHLLSPESLPQSREECVVSGDAAEALETICACAWDAPDDLALAEARKAVAGLRDDACVVRIIEDAHESADNRANDQAFGIVRFRGPVMPVLVHSTLAGFVTLLEEAFAGGANVTAENWVRLRRAFFLLFNILQHGDIGKYTDPLPVCVLIQPPGVTEEQHSALARWIGGHHMFMVLIQGLVIVFNSFQRELQEGQLQLARESLDAATCLMLGSGVALRFTGDFNYSDYEREVRPTLMPPKAPAGLTGLYWRDHEYLMKGLAKMRPLFSSLDPSLHRSLQSFREAIQMAYGSHIAVCSSFVGTAQPSLLLASRSDRSAVNTLDHFMHARLNLVKS